MVSSRQEKVRFYIKTALGTISFFVFMHYTYLQVLDPDVVVDQWVFIMLIVVMGSLLGVDMIDQYLGGGGTK